jgi:hypothetical protein
LRLEPSRSSEAAGHGLIRRHVDDVFLSVRRRGADGIDNPLGVASSVEMNQRHLYRLAVAGGGD